MDSTVYSALGPRCLDTRPASRLLSQALDCASREDWMSAYHVLQQAVEVPADKRPAHFMLWEVCQILGHPDVGLAHLGEALRSGPVTSRVSVAPRRRVLMLAARGDFQANLPLGALLEADDTELHTLWLSDFHGTLENPLAAFGDSLPQFDCVFIAIAEDFRHRSVLAAADRVALALHVPVINRGWQIAAVSRADAAQLLRDLPNAIVPSQVLMHRLTLAAYVSPSDHPHFPVIVRPSGSHAGKDLARIDDFAALQLYLARAIGDQFYVAPFVDYRSPDGLWRKYRIIFVDGRPFPYHMAIHDDWAVWYYNAHMERDAWKRTEEARFVEDITQLLPEVALNALRDLGERVGLDYFGIDCGLMPDGRLVVFEVETGMIVHDWDSPDVYPYKRDCAQRIRRATETMIDARVATWRQQGS